MKGVIERRWTEERKVGQEEVRRVGEGVKEARWTGSRGKESKGKEEGRGGERGREEEERVGGDDRERSERR